MKKFIPSLLCIVLVTACGPSNRERKLADEVQEADQRIAKQLLELQAERDTFAKNLAAAIKNANAWKDVFDKSAQTNKVFKAEIERLYKAEIERPKERSGPKPPVGSALSRLTAPASLLPEPPPVAPTVGSPMPLPRR